jgi:hypothetical protein
MARTRLGGRKIKKERYVWIEQSKRKRLSTKSCTFDAKEGKAKESGEEM